MSSSKQPTSPNGRAKDDSNTMRALGSPRDLSDLAEQHFDVVIIGGGVSGAWLALHCAQQGHKTALIEKYDYASQTSSSSSKLLHGGIRYLQQMQFSKVRESAMERAHYLYAAPHLSSPVPFIVPTYPDFKRSKFFLNCGMAAYRWLCVGENKIIESKDQRLPPMRSLAAPELNELCDLRDQSHTGGVVFYEQHMLDSERMVLAIVQTARKLGAQIHNYVSAEQFIGDNANLSGVLAKDQLSDNTFTINSRLIINAAGPWIDNLNATLKNAKQAPSINGFAIGSHIVTRQLSDHAIALTTQHQSDAKLDRGGRHIFVIPWRGYSLIGTSYNEIASPNGDIKIQADHVKQLLDAVNHAMPSADLGHDDLISGYSGLYPLRTDNIQSTVYQGTGEYQIIDHTDANDVSGIVTALGAKFTTGRKLSELTMRLVAKKLGATTAPLRKIKFSSANYQNLNEFIDAKTDQYKDKFAADTIHHLVVHYGSDIDAVIEHISASAIRSETICPGQLDIFGQVSWAIEHEQALTLNDILFNRTSLGLLGISQQEVHAVGTFMAEQLGWSASEHRAQLDQTLTRLTDIGDALTARGEA